MSGSLPPRRIKHETFDDDLVSPAALEAAAAHVEYLKAVAEHKAAEYALARLKARRASSTALQEPPTPAATVSRNPSPVRQQPHRDNLTPLPEHWQAARESLRGPLQRTRSVSPQKPYIESRSDAPPPASPGSDEMGRYLDFSAYTSDENDKGPKRPHASESEDDDDVDDMQGSPLLKKSTSSSRPQRAANKVASYKLPTKAELQREFRQADIRFEKEAKLAQDRARKAARAGLVATTSQAQQDLEAIRGVTRR